MSDFPGNLRKYRKMKKISQEKLGKKLNFGSTAIANYESGRNEPSIDTLIQIAKTLEVTVDELIGVELQSEERELLVGFKKINKQKRRLILELIKVLQVK